MITHRNAIAIGLVLLMTACGTPAPTVMPTPTLTRLVIPPGGTIRVPIEPKPGPTEESPILMFHFEIRDAAKKNLVKANSVKLGGKEIIHNASEFAVQMPGNTVDTPLLLRIEADGYESWEHVFRHRVNHSRTIYFVLELKRVLARSETDFCQAPLRLVC
jgi:hypothetical protein